MTLERPDIVPPVCALMDLYPALPVADQTRLARVDTSAGSLYRVADTGMSRLSAGDWVSGNEILRTGKQASTRLALDDGSVLEIEARTRLRNWLRDAIPAERQAVIDILAESGPWMHVIYREPDRVRLVVNGPLGLSLPELPILAGMGAGAVTGSEGT